MMLSRRQAVGAALGTGLLAANPLAARAPQRGGQTAAWYRFMLGGFECTVVSDGAIAIAPPHQIFGGTLGSSAEVEVLLRGAFLPTDVLPTQLNCLVVNTGSQLVLLDAGVGAAPAFGPGTGRLASALIAAGIQPAEIDLIAFTHAHPDHAWGVADAAGADLFPNARYAMSAIDFAFWTNEALLAQPDPVRAFVTGTRAALLPRRDKFTLFGANADIAAGIRAMDTPGHSPGHVSFLLSNGGQQLLVLGDVANHHVLALRRPDWPFVFDADPALAVATRRRVFGMAAADRLQLLGYHFPWPGLGHVEASGEGYGWTPSPWQWG